MTTLLDRTENVGVPNTTEMPRRSVRPGPFLGLVNGVAWITFLGLTMAAAPVSDAPPDAFGLAMSTAVWTTLLFAAVGLASRERWGYLATGVGGLVLIAMVGICAAGGHTGTWLAIQGLSGAGLAVTGYVSHRATA